MRWICTACTGSRIIPQNIPVCIALICWSDLDPPFRTLFWEQGLSRGAWLERDKGCVTKKTKKYWRTESELLFKKKWGSESHNITFQLLLKVHQMLLRIKISDYSGSFLKTTRIVQRVSFNFAIYIICKHPFINMPLFIYSVQYLSITILLQLYSCYCYCYFIVYTPIFRRKVLLLFFYSIRWKDRYHSHIFMVNMNLQPAILS